MDLDAPDLLALAHAGDTEEDVRPEAALEGGVEVCRHVCRENHHAGVLVQLLQQDVDRVVRLALVAGGEVGKAAGGDTVGFVEEEDGVRVPGVAESVADVLARLARPAALQLGIVYAKELLTEGVGDGFGANGFAGSGRSREVEREAAPLRVAL